MSFASTIIILGAAFVGLLIVVWLLMATSKSRELPKPAGNENAASEASPSAPDAAAKAAAETQNKNTTAAAAWWWLNHERDGRPKPPEEPK
jgi:hypothetical protein